MTEQTELLLRLSGTAVVTLLVVSGATAAIHNSLSTNHRLYPFTKEVWKWCLYIVVTIVALWILSAILNFIWTADSKTFK